MFEIVKESQPPQITVDEQEQFLESVSCPVKRELMQLYSGVSNTHRYLMMMSLTAACNPDHDLE